MDVDFAKVARVLASPARSSMAGALLDGRVMTAGELARVAGVGPSTASGHLAELVQGGLVRVSADGRHRYYGLAGTDIAEALEAFARICPATPVRSLRASAEARALAFARTCYDHLAGLLGVTMLDVLLTKGWLVTAQSGYAITRCGHDGLPGLGVDVRALSHQRRSLARPCLDWTARRSHLAGALGASITTSLLDQRWIERGTRRRALRLTRAGEIELRRILGLEVETGGAGLSQE